MPNTLQSRSKYKGSSPAKDLIRNRIDREWIRQFREQYYPDKPLAYLGLPGQDLLDILSWREFIGRFTAIESDVDDVKQALELTILKNRLERQAHVVYGNIDEILVDANSREKLRWPYEIANLDYCGGLVNKRSGETPYSQRLDAIRHLFVSQSRNAFIFLITLNLRDKDGGELETMMTEIETEFNTIYSLGGTEECFAGHRDLGNAGRLKIYLPIFLLNVVRDYKLHFKPPILYQGTKQMLHFSIICEPFLGMAAGRLVLPRDFMQVINMPLLVTDDGSDLREVQLPIISSV